MVDSPPTVERVVLVGFMASGKSTVAVELAGRLGWKAVDLDREIERREGTSVAEIFRTRGEAHFRALESLATRQLSTERRMVLSAGGGWLTNDGVRGALGTGTLMAWLRVRPETVVRRLDGRTADRPLLDARDPLPGIRRLLEEREPLYRSADFSLDTDGIDAREVAARIETELRTRGVLPGRRS